VRQGRRNQSKTRALLLLVLPALVRGFGCVPGVRFSREPGVLYSRLKSLPPVSRLARAQRVCAPVSQDLRDGMDAERNAQVWR
jgi:hypothetical protein